MREMKDSGVKWVGEIPSSWKVYKVKQIADSNNDVLPENYEEEQEIDYIEIGSVTYEHGVRTTEKMKFGNAPSIGYVLKMVTDKDIIPDEFRELYETFCNTLKIRR